MPELALTDHFHESDTNPESQEKCGEQHQIYGYRMQIDRFPGPDVKWELKNIGNKE